MLQAWAEVLGRQQVNPRRYDRSNWEAGDVVAVFASFLGVTESIVVYDEFARTGRRLAEDQQKVSNSKVEEPTNKQPSVNQLS